MPQINQYKILLIDDRHENLFALSAILKKAGYESDSALKGSEGLHLLLKNQYGLIILDVQMPEMNGFEVAELIKGNSKTKNIPIIFLSANAVDKDFFRKGHEVGALDYLTKPVDEMLLLLKVRNFLQLHHSTVLLDEANKELEKKAIRAEISYQDLYYSLTQDVFLINRKGIIVNINRTGILSSGAHTKELINQHYTKSLFLKEIIGRHNSEVDLDDFFEYHDRKMREEFEIQKGSTQFFGEALICFVLIDGEFHIQVCVHDITASKKAEAGLAREVRTTKKYQSMLLSSQINPHFTFNALNSVQYFILLKEDVESALNFVADFSHLMRNTLTNSRSEFIRISDEIIFLDLYLKLEQKRFDQKFSFTISVADGLVAEDLYIPPMLIQPYLENAVIHGLANNKKESKVQIRFLKKDDFISCVIKDNGIGREKAIKLKNLRSGGIKHQSMGMNITETRIKILNELYSDTFVVNVKDLKTKYDESNGTQVEIKLPVLTAESVIDLAE